jgi:hypothetical protein
MIGLVPEAAASGSQLQHLLADPEMAALAAAGPQLGRLLRPLCRALGVTPPPYLTPPPPPPPPRAASRAAGPPRNPRQPRQPGTIAARIRAAWPGLRRPYWMHADIAALRPPPKPA